MANLLNSIIYYLKDAIVKDGNGNVNISGSETVGGDETVNGDVYVDGHLTMRVNNRAIRFKDASDPAQIHSMVYVSQSNYFGIGYGMYNSNKGETRIYGDTLRMYSHNPITTDQGMEIGGSLTVGGHDSKIGDVRTARLASALSVDTATGKSLCSISLSKGTWQLIGQVRFPSNNTGARRANITTVNNGNDIHVQVSATQDGQTALQVICIADVTGTSETYYLNVYHNAGTALSMPAGTTEGYVNGIRAVRIA